MYIAYLLSFLSGTTLCSKWKHSLPLIAVVLAIVAILIAAIVTGLNAYVWLQRESETCTSMSYQQEAVSEPTDQGRKDIHLYR